MVPWSSGMIPPLQGGDHEFESRSLRIFIIFFDYLMKMAVLICQESRFFVLYRDTGKINLSLAGTLGK